MIREGFVRQRYEGNEGGSPKGIIDHSWKNERQDLTYNCRKRESQNCGASVKWRTAMGSAVGEVDRGRVMRSLADHAKESDASWQQLAKAE